jgi:thiol-disulfide isomerase/thioredoxin
MNAWSAVTASVVLSVGLAACSQSSPPASASSTGASDASKPTTTEAPKPTTAINWFNGDVDAAFERAKAENKPVFLYWGAEWCPPCHQLKATVFTRPDFIEKMKLFVPVYLDGDTAGAQKWGDVFKVSGYPTLVVLNADRTELTRIVGGMDLTEYDDVLDLVLGDVRPVRAVLDSLSGTNPQLSRDDCKRLAYNGWALDESVDEAPEKSAVALKRAADACPADARVEKARLNVAATYASLMADAKLIEAGKAPSARTAKLLDEVYNVLGEDKVSAGVRDVLPLLGDEYFAAEQKQNPKRAADLLERWTHMADAAANDPSLLQSDRTDAIAIKLKAVKALSPDHKIPPELVAQAQQRVDDSLAGDYPEHARPGVVNSAEWVLDTIGDKARMRSLLEHEISTAKQPYYYMLDLADLEEKTGNKDAAITLLERAYRESQGTATRFQWGTVYVMGLVRMRPEDASGIGKATLAVINELDGPDRIYMRTTKRLHRLDSALRDWNKKGKHAETIATIRKRMDDICSRIPEAQPARGTCNAFLSKA